MISLRKIFKNHQQTKIFYISVIYYFNTFLFRNFFCYKVIIRKMWKFNCIIPDTKFQRFLSQTVDYMHCYQCVKQIHYLL